MSSQGQVCIPPLPSPCQSAFPRDAFLSFHQSVLKGRFVILPFLLLVSLPFLMMLFCILSFPQSVLKGRFLILPFLLISPRSPSSFLPSSYFSSKKIYVFTWKVQERNRMWKLCASARDPWRQHDPHLWHPLLQSPLQVIFLLTM